MSGIMYKNRPYAGGGGAGGASALSDLTDTSISSPTNGQVLKYNNGFWENDDESGGTTVVANPTGTPTEELSTIQIGQDIYEIVGGGGGGGSIERDVLWTGIAHTVNDTFTLSDDITNYDFLMLYGRPTDVPSEYHIGILDVESLLTGISNNNAYFSYEYYDTQYTRGIFTDAHTFKVYQRNGNYDFTKIEGIKLGSGGGGGASDDYSTTEQTIGSWIDGKPIYQITYEPSSTLHTNGKAWVDTGMVISDIESIIDFEIVAKDTYVNKPANIKCAFFRYNNNNIQIYVVDQWYLDILAVTVKYTKTTD